MSSIYIYPKLDNSTLLSPNPYINNLENALASKHKLINTKPNTKGVVDFYKYIFKTKVYFFNWIEYLPNQKLGKIQVIFFVAFLRLAKFFGKKIVWVLHNKYSHTKLAHSDGVSFWKRYMFELMIKRSDFILTHSNSGYEFVKEKFPKHAIKVKYIIHPLDKLYPQKVNAKIEYDILIWGTIHPYKGVIDFLEYASKSASFKDLKIVILGICPDEELKSKLDGYLSNNILHYNKFSDFEEIAEYANKSRFVLFTYNSDSVLSSGSLMDSISMGATVIGPDKGAFRDLSDYQFVKTYRKFDELLEIIYSSRGDNKNFLNNNDLEDFYNQNKWEKFLDNAGVKFQEIVK